MPPHSMKHIYSTIHRVSNFTHPPTAPTAPTAPTLLTTLPLPSPLHHHLVHSSLFAVLTLSCLVVSLLTVRHFLSPSARQLHVVVASAGALCIGFTTVLLPSFDVYVSATHAVDSDSVHTIYLFLFAVTGLWLGAVLPFSFFFATSAKSSPSMPVCRRLCNTLQSTALFLLVLVVLLVAGLVVRPGHETWSAKPLTQHWMDKVFDTKHQGTSALLFLIGVLASVGCVGFIVYTGYGMATVPLDLIRGYKDPELERLEVETKLIQLKSRLRKLDKKNVNNKKQQHWNQLNQTLGIKRQHIRALDRLSEGGGTSCWGVRLVGPCRIVVGSLLLVVTCVLTSALVLSASDPGLENASGCLTVTGKQKIDLSNVKQVLCQAETGYLGTLLNKPQLFNPFDALLVKMSFWFPLDMMVLSCTLAYLFFASLYGVLRLGLRCCVCLAVYRFQRRATSSSAMLVLGAVQLFVALALLVQVPVLAPKYATFGKQTVGGTVHCSSSDGADDWTQEQCTMSQVAVLLVTLVKEFPVYSHIFYITSWLHAVVVGLSLLLRCCCGGRADNFTDNDFYSMDEHSSVGGGGGDRGEYDSDVELASKQSLLAAMDSEEPWDWNNRRKASGSSRSKFGSLANKYG